MKDYNLRSFFTNEKKFVMLPTQKNLHLPAELPMYFDDFITRDNFKAARRRLPVQISLMPATSLYETPESFIIEMATPGISHDDLRFFTTDRSIEVRYEPETGGYEPYGSRRIWHREFHLEGFQRKFEFNPEMLDVDQLQVSSTHGMIRIELPKQESVRGQVSPMEPFSLN